LYTGNLLSLANDPFNEVSIAIACSFNISSWCRYICLDTLTKNWWGSILHYCYIFVLHSVVLT
jgi:hypothetical protein